MLTLRSAPPSSPLFLPRQALTFHRQAPMASLKLLALEPWFSRVVCALRPPFPSPSFAWTGGNLPLPGNHGLAQALGVENLVLPLHTSPPLSKGPLCPCGALWDCLMTYLPPTTRCTSSGAEFPLPGAHGLSQASGLNCCRGSQQAAHLSWPPEPAACAVSKALIASDRE